jgi:hypothetical protein
MQRKVSAAAIVVAAVALALAGLSPRQAEAHERRTVAGQFTFVVGFITEPPITGVPNGIDLRITDAQSNQPVEGAEKTLKADVMTGGQMKTYELTTRFNMPGAYTAHLIPTKAGTWTFRFYGTLNGTPIDERFESGPGRFNDVQLASTLEFPQTTPTQPGATTTTPSNEADVSAATEAQRALDEAEDARTIGIAVGTAGIVVGLIGIALAAVALNTRRPRATGGGPAEPV